METFSAILALYAGNSPVTEGQWHGALMLSLIWAWMNGWVNNREAGDFRQHRAHYDVTVMVHNCIDIRSFDTISHLRLDFIGGSFQPTLNSGIADTHYNGVIMGAAASQITGVSIVYSAVCSDADERKHQSPVSLAFVRGIHRWPVTSPHKGPVAQKMFPFDDVIMIDAIYFLTQSSLQIGHRRHIIYCFTTERTLIWGAPKIHWNIPQEI